MAANKYIVHSLKLRIPASQAAPGASINQTLGQYGVKIPQFCQEFNEATQLFKEGTLVGVRFLIYNDRSYKFTIKKPSTSTLIKIMIKNVKNDPRILATFNKEKEKGKGMEERKALLLEHYHNLALLLSKDSKEKEYSKEWFQNTIRTLHATTKSCHLTDFIYKDNIALNTNNADS